VKVICLKKLPTDYSYLEANINDIELRLEFLYCKMLHFIENNDIKNELRISKELTEQLMLDYFTDIIRLKSFHGIEYENTSKIDGYLCYWILRRKPIQVIGDVDVTKLMVNELFVCNLLIYTCLSEVSDPTKYKEDVLSEFRKHLFYHLRFRRVDQQGLELLIFAFQSALKLF